jgi:hypothetical protein
MAAIAVAGLILSFFTFGAVAAVTGALEEGIGGGALAGTEGLSTPD